MSKINDLIKELCPNGVEKVSLGSLMHRIKEKNYENSEIEIVYSVTKENGIVKSDDLHDFSVYSSDLTNYNILKFNQYAYNPARLNIGSIARLKENEPGLVSPMYIVFELDSTKIDYEYYEHLLFSDKVFNDMCSFVEQGARFRFDYQNWDKVIIDLPPLIVQKEIVKILNKFKELEHVLQLELKMRQKQYHFWCEKLFSKQYETKFLPDLSINMDNKRKAVTKGVREAGEYPYYGASGIVDFVSNYLFDDELLLVSEDGANLLARSTPIAFSATGKVWVNNHAHVLKFHNKITQKYVEHYLNMMDLSEYITGAAQPKLNKDNLNKIRINIPSIEEQEKIVHILDKFDKLINDKEIGLPAEIDLRKQQYEYYRNKLLSFEELSVSE